MKQFKFSIMSTIVCVIYPVLVSQGIDIKDTKFLSQPAISENHIAFTYAGDLWIANVDGNNARRLTSDDGSENNPVFSPNGELIAFSAEYDGNTDVYVLPVEGGIPKRLTWHPGFDGVSGFTPDGSSVLFYSSRNVSNWRHTQLFTVPINGGFPTRLQIPYAYKACYSPDDKRLAYNPLSERFRQWKNYRGGTVSTIWLYTFDDHSVVKIPQPDGRCNDITPMWLEESIYFLSDRNGEFNLFHYDIASRTIEQLTHFTDFPILNASLGGRKIIYEQAGHLFTFDISNGSSSRLKIGIATDLLELRPRYAKGARYIRNASISPSGSRAVLDFRGEVITVPAEKGDPRNLTQSPGAHERFPVWSSDGNTIAYFSDELGEYELHLKQQDGKGDVKKFQIDGSGFYSRLAWSPDSEKLTFADNARNLYWLDITKGSTKKIATDNVYDPGAFGNIQGEWSPDSRWIAYTINTAAYIEKVYLYSLEEDKSYPITDGLSNVSGPVFDESGKYIYFFASTDAGPIKHWFAMSNSDMRMTRSIYLATLRKDIPSPLAKESDEEEGIKKEEENKDNDNDSEKKESEKEEEESEKPIQIDFDGMSNRILSIPVEAGNYFNLQVGDEGKVYYLEAPAIARGPDAKETKLHMYDLEEREDKVIINNVNFYQLSHDKKKILYRTEESWKIVSTSGQEESDKGNLNINSIQVHIDPKSEWEQIFYEAWRINRDYFYATNMHGCEWEAMREKYSTFLPHLSCREDLNRLIRWMCSELGVGHHRVRGGDFYYDPERIPGGLLGADYAIENGRYRFKKIYGGLNWTPDLRSPLTEPGLDINEGDYLLAVNGRELYSSMNLYGLFENTAEKIVEITVAPTPNAEERQTFSVVPVRDERALRNRDWVEGNLKRVDEATNGRVAYVYVPNTTSLGHAYFKRYFFPQVYKEAIIIDERFNRGGLVADYYIDLLRRPFVCNWNTRYCADIKTPSASIQGPKVMLIDETAGSGGDLLPWMFRKFNLGKLIGKRTWGGLVGTLGFPDLMDGAYVSAPNLAIWTEDGWIVENVGVHPDIDVEQWPEQVISGHDPQLEKAIEVIMDELKKAPPKKMKRPPYPVRVRAK